MRGSGRRCWQPRLTGVPQGGVARQVGSKEQGESQIGGLDIPEVFERKQVQKMI